MSFHLRASDILPVFGTVFTFLTANVNAVISLVAGVLTIVYTAMRICDWLETRREKKRRKALNENASPLQSNPAS